MKSVYLQNGGKKYALCFPFSEMRLTFKHLFIPV